jgi:hypothetical protein
MELVGYNHWYAHSYNEEQEHSLVWAKNFGCRNRRLTPIGSEPLDQMLMVFGPGGSSQTGERGLVAGSGGLLWQWIADSRLAVVK